MKIIISENCFGADVRINDESLFQHEYDQRTSIEIENLQQSLLDEISKIKSNLDMRDWASIAEILVSRNKDFEYNVDSSTEHETCDQCGNYNHFHLYEKIAIDDQSNTK